MGPKQLFSTSALAVLALTGAQADVVLTQTSVIAATNAFAPLDKSLYFDKTEIQNQSPMTVNAFGDWYGKNIGGQTDTWHWSGSSQANFAAASNVNRLQASATARFTWTMTTTSDFVSPGSEVVVYEPQGAATFKASFLLSEPGQYRVNGTLTRYASVSIYSVSTSTTVYLKGNTSNTPFSLDVSGVLPPGEYSVGGGAAAAGVDSRGEFTMSRTGSFTDFVFTVQVPEPSCIAFGGVMGAMACRPRRFRRTIERTC